MTIARMNSYNVFEASQTKVALHKCSMKKLFQKNITKFKGKHLCLSFFFNEVADPRPLGDCFWRCNLLGNPPVFIFHWILLHKSNI